MVKTVCWVISPTSRVAPPTANTIGQMLAPGGSIAASEVATAVVSMADRLESRAQTLNAASAPRATAAEISPTMPSASFCETP